MNTVREWSKYKNQYLLYFFVKNPIPQPLILYTAKEVGSMASSKRDLKRKCKKEMITSTVVEGILFVYFGLLLGAAYLNVPPEEVFFEGSKTFLDAALYLVPYFMESPFGIWPSNILGISTTALIWLVCFMYNYQQYVRKYNTMYEDAYGSGGFNDDLEEYYRNMW